MTNSETSGVELPDMDLLKKFDVPAPRYTSYPTADRFNAEFTAEDYARALAGRGTAKEPAPLSLYVHVPFCNDVCFYCGCNKIVTRDHSRSAAYIDLIGQEADLVKAHLTGSQELEQLHFGGGTPTFLTEDELELMMGRQKESICCCSRRCSDSGSCRRSKKTGLCRCYPGW